jgi:copper chaperone CopZ
VGLLPGITKIDVNLALHRVTVLSDYGEPQEMDRVIQQAIVAAGYPVEGARITEQV